MNITVEVTDPDDRARTQREVAGAVTSWAHEHMKTPPRTVEAVYPHPGGEALVMLRDRRGLVGNFTVTVQTAT